MSGRDLCVPGAYVTPMAYRLKAQKCRVAKRLAGVCINGTMNGRSRTGIEHGPANSTSGKCDRCEIVAAQSRRSRS